MYRFLFEQQGLKGLIDRTSRPVRTRSSVDTHLAQLIERLRRQHMPPRRIAQIVGRSVATVSRVLAQLGLSSLKALEPNEPVVRYEREAPGDLLHMDMKKLARIATVGHRVTGDHRDHTRCTAWVIRAR